MENLLISNDVSADLDLIQKRLFYSSRYSSGTNVNQSFNEKLELITALGYLTVELKKRNKIKESSLEVLEKIYNREINTKDGAIGEDSYLTGLSIVTDDLIWGCNDVTKPADCNNAQEVVNKIKNLIAAWLPF